MPTGSKGQRRLPLAAHDSVGLLNAVGSASTGRVRCVLGQRCSYTTTIKSAPPINSASPTNATLWSGAATRSASVFAPPLKPTAFLRNQLGLQDVHYWILTPLPTWMQPQAKYAVLWNSPCVCFTGKSQWKTIKNNIKLECWGWRLNEQWCYTNHAYNDPKVFTLIPQNETFGAIYIKL